MAPSQQFRVSKSRLQATLKDEARQRLQQAVEPMRRQKGRYPLHKLLISTRYRKPRYITE